MSKFIVKLLPAVALLCAGAIADASPAVNLGLVIDSSGSIGTSNFNIVKSGYASALASLPTDGSVAIAVDDFSSNGQSTIFPDLVISNTADLASLINFVNGMPYYGGLTALSDAILNTGSSMFGANVGAAKSIIDVSTDGGDNDSTFSLGTHAASLAAIGSYGINEVNCLGIGTYADCSLQAGTGSFSYPNVSYADFPTILATKIKREVYGVPEPGPLPLFAVGLAAVGLLASRRRRSPSP